MNKKLNITLAQINPIVGGLDYNFQKICDVWSSAPADTDLIVFPEMVVCGYPPEDLILKPFFLEQVQLTVDKIVKFSAGKKSAAVIPAPWVSTGKTYNAMHVIENGKITATITKHHLPNYGVFDEQRVFASGPKPDPIQFRGFSLGLLICEDMWYPDVSLDLKYKNADILIVPNASPYEIGKENTRRRLAHDRVFETGLPLIYVHQVGGQDELVFDGGSFAMDETGGLVLEGNQFVEEIYNLTLEKTDRGVLITSTYAPARAYELNEEIYQALMLGLRDYIGKNKFPGVLIGLSGGIDSALSAAIAVDALGADKVHGVLMPSIYTSKDSTEDAQALAKNLGIKMDTISIEKAVEAYNNLLSGHIKASGITLENIQPRARGMILMALSNEGGKMVLSTSNKSEIAVGYATLYGDMCGGFNVLKDIYKTQVYDLSRWRNTQKPFQALGPDGAVIPARSISKAPTAELRANQTDQDTLPPYDILDSILQSIVEDELGVDDIVKKGHDRETVLRVWAMVDRAEYKRRQSAPGVKITRRAFGRDRRYPITSHFVKIIT